MKTDNFIILAGLIAVAVRTEASTGYLRVVGPSPIYFRMPRPTGAVLRLPPLDMGGTPVNLESPTAKGSADSASWAPPSLPDSTATEISAKSPAPAFGPGPGTVAPIVPAPAVNLGVGPVETGQSADSPFLLPLSTQALIPFFTRQFSGGTNAPKVTVVLPVEFHPARPPAAPPSSSATFTQDKKQP